MRTGWVQPHKRRGFRPANRVRSDASSRFLTTASQNSLLHLPLYNSCQGGHIPPLMWLSILIPILLVILVVVCLLLLLVVLMQRPRSEGLGAAFGSGMTENIFGAQTSSVLTKATVYLGAIFFGVTLLLTFLTAKQSLERRAGVLESEAKNAKPLPSATPSAVASSSPVASASPKRPPRLLRSRRFRRLLRPVTRSSHPARLPDV